MVEDRVESVAEKIGMRFQLGLTHLEIGRRLKDGGIWNRQRKINEMGRI